MSGLDWRTRVIRLPERIWFRMAAFAALALALVAAARIAGPHAPAALSLDIGREAALRILQILATSMLAVTTFSLTAMISAYGAAARGTTPRATQLLVADRTSQNALSTFLGAFVFSIVGVIALSTHVFTDAGRSMLFLGTLAVIAAVVATLLRWIHHLTRLGRIPDVIDRLESAALDAVRAYAREPHLGGVPPVAVPEGAFEVGAARSGNITGIVMEQLEREAVSAGGSVHVNVLPGAHVGVGAVLARVSVPLDDAARGRVRAAFRIEGHRTFEQDPSLGMMALAEMGSRALSPAENDAGTAVEVLGSLQRVLTELVTAREPDAARFAHVHVPHVSLADVLDEAVRPLARDGAGTVEVAVRLQTMLGDLVRVAVSESHRVVLLDAADRAADRALRSLDATEDAHALRAARPPRP